MRNSRWPNLNESRNLLNSLTTEKLVEIHNRLKKQLKNNNKPHVKLEQFCENMRDFSRRMKYAHLAEYAHPRDRNWIGYSLLLEYVEKRYSDEKLLLRLVKFIPHCQHTIYTPEQEGGVEHDDKLSPGSLTKGVKEFYQDLHDELAKEYNDELKEKARSSKSCLSSCWTSLFGDRPFVLLQDVKKVSILEGLCKAPGHGGKTVKQLRKMGYKTIKSPLII